MNLFSFFALCIVSILLNSTGVLFAQEKLAEPIFQVKMPSPTLVTVCGESLWAYSVELNEIFLLQTKTGAVTQKYSIDRVLPGELLTSLSCTSTSLIFGTVHKFDRDGDKLLSQVISLYRFSIPQGAAGLGNPEKLLLPETSLIRSLDASKVGMADRYILVQNKVYQSSDLSNWKVVEVPHSAEVKPTDADTAKNPFADWQEAFLISQGRYAKAVALDEGGMALLDPFRAHVVIKSKDTAFRWGRWGTRNGKLMFAKSLAMISKDVVVISDVGLKLVFFFDINGNYIGSTGKDGTDSRFGYPVSVATHNDQFYVADYFGNQLFAFNFKRPISSYDTVEGQKLLENKSFIANDLFRNPETQKTYDIVRCLNCHDGLEKFSLDKFVLEKKRHPTGVEQKTKIDLPLAEGNKVSCYSCHQPHHQSLSGVVTDQYGEDQKAQKLPYMLRKPVKELCLTCHTDRESAEKNHMGLKSTKLQKFRIEVKTCTQCHQLHAAEPKLLKKTVSDLCLNCHGQARKPKSHPFGKATLEKEEFIVSCVSCHATHGAEKAEHFARKKTKDSEGACLNCHKNRVPMIGKNEHLKSSDKLKMKTKWADSSVFCLNCHDPHDEKKPASKACASCHQDRVSKSHDIRIEALFERAGIEIPAGVKLVNGWLTCSVCHDPHLSSDVKSLLRPGKEKIVQLCGVACHSPEGALERYEKYHLNLGKKRKGK